MIIGKNRQVTLNSGRVSRPSAATRRPQDPQRTSPRSPQAERQLGRQHHQASASHRASRTYQAAHPVNVVADAYGDAFAKAVAVALFGIRMLPDNMGELDAVSQAWRYGLIALSFGLSLWAVGETQRHYRLSKRTVDTKPSAPINVVVLDDADASTDVVPSGALTQELLASAPASADHSAESGVSATGVLPLKRPSVAAGFRMIINLGVESLDAYFAVTLFVDSLVGQVAGIAAGALRGIKTLMIDFLRGDMYASQEAGRRSLAETQFFSGLLKCLNTARFWKFFEHLFPPVEASAHILAVTKLPKILGYCAPVFATWYNALHKNVQLGVNIAIGVYGYIFCFQSEAGLQRRHDMKELRAVLEALGFPMEDFGACSHNKHGGRFEKLYDFLFEGDLLIRMGGKRAVGASKWGGKVPSQIAMYVSGMCEAAEHLMADLSRRYESLPNGLPFWAYIIIAAVMAPIGFIQGRSQFNSRFGYTEHVQARIQARFFSGELGPLLQASSANHRDRDSDTATGTPTPTPTSGAL